nr:flavodoxin family protein [Sedimentibacter sp.]
MKVVAVNGSPRKKGNTAVLLQNVLRGAEANGAETNFINLYELNFTGCISCFSCKRKDSRCNGLCAVRDDLTEVLEDILSCDFLILGSPIYFGDVTGEMRSFLERLIFPNHSYNTGKRSIFQGRITSCFIYTMNVTEEQARQMNYEDVFQKNKNLLNVFHGEPEILISYDTYQFNNYSLYEASKFDEGHKAEIKMKQFPVDCQKAFEMGTHLVKRSLGNY